MLQLVDQFLNFQNADQIERAGRLVKEDDLQLDRDRASDVADRRIAFRQGSAAKVHQLEADMLVMGGYIRNRLLELLFGGVTRYMLGHADIPLLMRH